MIRLGGITKIYGTGDGAIRALDGVDLAVDSGEHVAIVGPSGSGKSTLLSILGLLDSPDKGTYCLNGEDVSTKNDRELSRLRNRTFGFIFQSFHLLPRYTALENVEVPLRYGETPRRERRELALEALRTVGLLERASHTPSELSGGQQQRVAIARALVTQPKILLADEPTGNLDSVSAQAIMETLDALNERGLTLIMITHSDEIARHAEKVIELRDGHIAGEVECYEPARR